MLNGFLTSGNHTAFADDENCKLHLKGYASIYNKAGFIFMGIAIVAAIFGGLDGGVFKVIFGLAILLGFVPAFFLNNWNLSIKNGILTYSNYLGITKSTELSNISGYKTGENQEIIIYEKDKKFCKVDEIAGSCMLMQICIHYDIPCLNPKEDDNLFVLSFGNSYIILITILCSVVSGILLALTMEFVSFCLTSSAIAFIFAVWISTEKIVVTKKGIKRTKFLGDTIGIYFSELEKAEIHHGSGGYSMWLYVKGTVVLKVSSALNNSYRFRELLEKKGKVHKEEFYS